MADGAAGGPGGLLSRVFIESRCSRTVLRARCARPSSGSILGATLRGSVFVPVSLCSEPGMKVVISCSFAISSE